MLLIDVQYFEYSTSDICNIVLIFEIIVFVAFNYFGFPRSLNLKVKFEVNLGRCCSFRAGMRRGHGRRCNQGPILSRKYAGISGL